MLPFKILKSLIAPIFLLSAQVSAISGSENVAVYWGQNSEGSQGALSTYCASSTADIIILSFLNDFPSPLNLNFANQCGTTFTDGLLHCPTIGEDITTCQAAGKTILLSLGGSVGTYGFTSDTEATEFATTLWNKFGGGSDSERPFDTAIVDGFDFDIENDNQAGYVALASALRTLFEGASKTYYLSSSPQCVYPDASNSDLLSQADLDYAFIQFYNNDCALNDDFNFATWADFAKTAPNPDIKLFVGLPGASVSGTGYVSADTVESAIEGIKCDSSFGGISLWDASSAWSNVDANGDNYAVQMKNLLETETCASSSSSSATASSTSSTSSITPTSSSALTSSTAAIISVTSVTPAELSFSYSNSTTSFDPSQDLTQTVTDVQTTEITITSCSDNKCTEVPVTTGYVVFTDDLTSYTTYCPLSTAVGPSTTVVTVTSCEDNKCTASTFTTGVTVVTDVNTIYTTYCPLSAASEASVETSSAVSNTSFTSAGVVSSYSAEQSPASIISDYEGMASKSSITWTFVIASILTAVF